MDYEQVSVRVIDNRRGRGAGAVGCMLHAALLALV